MPMVFSPARLVRMRLSTRIALAVGVVVPVLVLAAGWLLFVLVARDLHAAQDAHLRERARLVKDDARRLLRVTADGRTELAQLRERQMYGSALDVGIRVEGPYGTVAGGPQPDARTRLPKAAPRPVTVRGRAMDHPGAGARTGAGHGKGKRWRVLSVPVRGARPGVHGTLWLFSPDTASQTELAVVRERLTGVALLAAPVSGLLAWAVAAGASRPLRRLQRRTSGLDPRAHGSRLEHAPSGIVEVDELAGTLGTVLARYDQQAARTTEALDTARSFSSAAAHELRTPLMSMRTNLDVLAEHPDLDGEDRAEVVAELRHEHARLTGMLAMLRELGRGDLVEADSFVPLELGEVVEAAVADARRTDRAARIAVADTAPGATVRAWAPGLRTLLDNLLRNALTHGRSPDEPGARIEVGVWAQYGVSGGAGAASGAVRSAGGSEPPGVIVLTVDDHGPGIPEERRASVFRRFERGAHSGGTGLGLTLVAQQAALHGAAVRILDRPDGAPGTRFELRFPAFPRAGAASRPSELPAQRDWLIGTAPGGGPGTAAAALVPQETHKERP